VPDFISFVAIIMTDHLWRSNPDLSVCSKGVTLGASRAFESEEVINCFEVNQNGEKKIQKDCFEVTVRFVNLILF